VKGTVYHHNRQSQAAGITLGIILQSSLTVDPTPAAEVLLTRSPVLARDPNTREASVRLVERIDHIVSLEVRVWRHFLNLFWALYPGSKINVCENYS
jgi:hypothetical protein